MNGFGANSSFGQQAGAQQGANTLGSLSAGFGAKRTQSFGGPSSSAAPSTGLFGQPAGSTAQATPSLFGQSNQQPQQAQQGGGLFGSSNQANQQPSSSGLFGNTATPASGGLFGNTSSTSSFGGSGGGLFGNTGSASNTNTGFGSGTNTNAGFSGGGLFGSNNNTSQQGQPQGGLFGSAANTASTPGAPQGGLFGSANNTGAKSGNLFGNTNTNQSAGSFGGLNNASSKPLFGSASGTGTSSTGGLFGQSQQQPSQGGGLFGGSGGLKPAGTEGLGSGGLFKGGSSGSGLFGGATGASNGQAGSSSTGGLFGSSAQPGSIFGQQPQMQQQQPAQAQQQLIATIDQASFQLPGVAPSQKLYSSLSTQAPKRNASSAEHNSYGFEQRPRSITRGNVAPGRQGLSRPRPHPGLSQEARLYTAKAGLISSNESVIGPSKSQGEPHKWINSYEKFVRERPTTLVIRPSTRKPVAALSAKPELAPVAQEPPAISANPDASRFVNPNAESSFRRGSGHAAGAGDYSDIDEQPDVSLFHRQASNMTLVKVNKQAVEDGYYIYPRLEELAAMSKSQLSAVDHLVIGRENFGQIEYPEPVDLSHIKNLGDILGTLVVFGAGTVCVYPDESATVPPGRELNRPSTVSIENAWPRDAVTHDVIKDMEDPRMLKHIKRLRLACENRGGEFVTFAQGLWVFKVPHFSTWGLPANEMIVDDIDEPEFVDKEDVYVEDDILAAESDSSPVLAGNKFSDSASTPDFIAEGLDVKDGAEAPGLDATSDGTRYPPGEAAANNTSLEEPQTWQEQLISASNGILLAALDSVEAASKPTESLDLHEILQPPPKQANEPLSATDKQTDFRPSSSSVSSLKFSNVRSSLIVKSRKDSQLPLLQTNMDFKELQQVSVRRREFWELLSILFDRDEAHSPIEELRGWLEKRCKPKTSFSGDALDTIWELVSRHRVKEAFQHAVTSNNPHLGLLITLLSNRASLDKLNEDAKHQLDDWQSTRTVTLIPSPVRRIWELAAGTVPSATYTWEQWLGLNLWYLPNTTPQSVVLALPSSYAGVKDAELAFLQFSSCSKQLRTALRELDLLDQFLCLQGISKNRPSAIRADLTCYDNVCVELSDAFSDSGDSTMAVYAALHITETKLASRTMRSVLNAAPTPVSLPLDLGVPEPFLNESRAFQVAKEGEFDAQAEYLVRAGLYNEAHNVVLAIVAPGAILAGEPSRLLKLLSTLEANKNTIRRWEQGGAIYLAYARAVTEGADQYAVVSLCDALRWADTPSLQSKEAISRIAEWVASTVYAKTTLTSQMILKMKFDSSQRRVQVLQEAARLLQ